MNLLIRSVLLMMALFYISGCKEDVPKKEVIRSVRAMQVLDPTEFTSRSFPGQAKATREVELSFQVPGPLVSRPVNVGDRVKKGQTLSQILTRDFQVRLDQAKAVNVKAKEQYQRYKELYSRQQVSKADFDQYRAEWAVTKAKLADAENALKDTTLQAPFNGIVTTIYVENFEDVQAKQPILRLIDYAQIEMIVNLPESYISGADQIQAAGDVLRVRFDPFPNREIKARIKEIGKEASRTTRTYPVTLIMDQPKDIQILPGMAGKARSSISIPETGRKIAIVVPETAIFSGNDNSKTYIWIIDTRSNTVGRREIKTGELHNTGISVSEGLNPGEWVATAGAHYLKDGQQVRIMEPSKAEVAK